MKNWKNLFIKDEDETEDDDSSPKSTTPPPSFPVGNTPNTPQKSNPLFEEILEVYEGGLKSINMPGYDFFEFYNTIKAGGSHSESVYKMAFQMGKTMDATITPQKLVSDADYYISKIREVHESYANQGKKKLDSIEGQLKTERDNLSSEATRIESDISKMKQQIQALETKLAETRDNLGKVEGKHKPKRDDIQEKLSANDQAMEAFVQKLTLVQSSISKYL